jgi:urease accessory protein
MTRLRSRAVALLAGPLSFSTTAFAHSGEGVVGGLLSGLLHPISGLDHVVAMVGVASLCAC